MYALREDEVVVVPENSWKPRPRGLPRAGLTASDNVALARVGRDVPPALLSPTRFKVSFDGDGVGTIALAEGERRPDTAPYGHMSKLAREYATTNVENMRGIGARRRAAELRRAEWLVDSYPDEQDRETLARLHAMLEPLLDRLAPGMQALVRGHWGTPDSLRAAPEPLGSMVARYLAGERDDGPIVDVLTGLRGIHMWEAMSRREHERDVARLAALRETAPREPEAAAGAPSFR